MNPNSSLEQSILILNQTVRLVMHHVIRLMALAVSLAVFIVIFQHGHVQQPRDYAMSDEHEVVYFASDGAQLTLKSFGATYYETHFIFHNGVSLDGQNFYDWSFNAFLFLLISAGLSCHFATQFCLGAFNSAHSWLYRIGIAGIRFVLSLRVLFWCLSRLQPQTEIWQISVIFVCLTVMIHAVLLTIGLFQARN